MEYWVSKTDDGQILISDPCHPYKIDPISLNPSFPGPDRFHRKIANKISCFNDTQMVTVQKIVAPGRANTPLFHHSAMQSHGTADFL